MVGRSPAECAGLSDGPVLREAAVEAKGKEALRHVGDGTGPDVAPPVVSQWSDNIEVAQNRRGAVDLAGYESKLAT